MSEDARLKACMEIPYRLRQLTAKYGERLGQMMYDREQNAREYELIEEIEQGSEDLAIRENQIAVLIQTLKGRIEQDEEMFKVLWYFVRKVQDNKDVNSFAILAERDPNNPMVWKFKEVVKSFRPSLKHAFDTKQGLLVKLAPIKEIYVEIGEINEGKENLR